MSRFFKKGFRRPSVTPCLRSEAVVQSDVEYVSPENMIVCAIMGRVYAIHKLEGRRIWRTKLPSGFCGVIASILITNDDKIIVGGGGRTACLNLKTGALEWSKKLPRRWISNGVTVNTTPIVSEAVPALDRNVPVYEGLGSPDVPQTSITSKTKLVESLTSYDSSTHSTDNASEHTEHRRNGCGIVVACMWGRCFALDITTGDRLWTFHCPKGGFALPTVIIEQVIEANRAIFYAYVSCGKMLYCLRAQTGDLVWSHKVTTSFWSYSYTTIATPWNSRLASELYTGGFSSQPTAQIAAHEQNLATAARIAARP